MSPSQSSKMPRIIDTHHHLYPPRYVSENLELILERSDVLDASIYLNWTPCAAVERMDQTGVATAIK